MKHLRKLFFIAIILRFTTVYAEGMCTISQKQTKAIVSIINKKVRISLEDIQVSKHSPTTVSTATACYVNAVQQSKPTPNFNTWLFINGDDVSQMPTTVYSEEGFRYIGKNPSIKNTMESSVAGGSVDAKSNINHAQTGDQRVRVLCNANFEDVNGYLERLPEIDQKGKYHYLRVFYPAVVSADNTQSPSNACKYYAAHLLLESNAKKNKGIAPGKDQILPWPQNDERIPLSRDQDGQILDYNQPGIYFGKVNYYQAVAGKETQVTQVQMALTYKEAFELIRPVQ